MSLAARLSRFRISQAPLILLLSPLAILATFMCGCGGNGGASPGRILGPTPNTQVTVLVSSKANDQLSAFTLTTSSITLTNTAGNTVNLLQTPQITEFVHLNGNSAPLVTVSVPQGSYTSAALTFSDPAIECVTLNSTGGAAFNTYGNELGNESATVNLASPLTISGNGMGLSLELQVSQSENLSRCEAGEAYSITPVFNLAPVVITSEPSNDLNGKITGIRGRVASLITDGFSLLTTNGYSFQAYANGPTLSFTTNENTTYQGISGLSALAANMFVDMDAVIQSDGSLLASRVEADDPTALNMMVGPLLTVFEQDGSMLDMGRQQQGNDLSANPISAEYFSFSGSTVFRISSQLGSLQSLPFQASFTASNMVPGQNAAVFSQAISTSGGQPYTAATTITLMPQTIDGTVTAVSSNGGFATYTVTLALYDLFPVLAVQPGQTTLLTNPTTVVVYTDSSTQLLNSMPLAAGSALRFNGLVFNDKGNLRMVCGVVQDGIEP